MENGYKGRNALVTGGSSGIGLAIARQLVQAGANTWIIARDPDRLAATLAHLQEDKLSSEQMVSSLQIDLSNLEEVQSGLGRYLGEFGPPDYLFNIAGFCQPGYVEQVSLEIYRATMEINYFGTLYPTQTLLPDMIRRGRGHIINVSSIVGYVGLFGYAPYSASKYAIRGYTDILRVEMKPKGVRVSIVFPPDTDTPQLAYENQYKVPETLAVEEVVGQTKALPPEAVASIILKQVARGKYQIFPGPDNRMIYSLQSVLMDLIYPIMDFLVKRAYRRMEKRKYSRSEQT